MIQRVQTLFLLAVLVLQALVTILPLAEFILPDYNLQFTSRGFVDLTTEEILIPTTPLLILCLGIAFINLVTIFIYKKRELQMRMCIYNMLLSLGLIGMLVMQITNFTKNNDILAHTYLWPLTIPVVNIILLILAYRGIRKDELLVKAYDRLR